MSQGLNPEIRSHSSQEDEDVKKEKTKKNVKIENVKRENECRKKLGEISPPRVRKIAHKMMTKYYNDPFYKTNDIAKKILNKLKVPTTQHFMRRIKKNMEKWIKDNVIMPYPVVPGYSPSVYYPSEFYQPYYQNYPDPNLYNPYFFPYGYQYPYNPYFYRPSDFLANYPVDETAINNATGSQPLDPQDADAGGSYTLEGSDIRQ